MGPGQCLIAGIVFIVSPLYCADGGSVPLRGRRELADNLIVPSIALVLKKGELVSTTGHIKAPSPFLVPPSPLAAIDFSKTNGSEALDSYLLPPLAEPSEQFRDENVTKSEVDELPSLPTSLVPPERDAPVHFRVTEDVPPAPLTYETPPRLDAPGIFRLNNSKIAKPVQKLVDHLVPPLLQEPVIFRKGSD